MTTRQDTDKLIYRNTIWYRKCSGNLCNHKLEVWCFVETGSYIQYSTHVSHVSLMVRKCMEIKKWHHALNNDRIVNGKWLWLAATIPHATNDCLRKRDIEKRTFCGNKTLSMPSALKNYFIRRLAQSAEDQEVQGCWPFLKHNFLKITSTWA